MREVYTCNRKNVDTNTVYTPYLQLTSVACWRWSRLCRWTVRHRRRTAVLRSTTACGRRYRWNIWDGRQPVWLAEPGRAARCLVHSLHTWCQTVYSRTTRFKTIRLLFNIQHVHRFQKSPSIYSRHIQRCIFGRVAICYTSTRR